jgi:hypothetical protein
MVYGQSHRDRRLARLVDESNSAKFAALLKIQQRALQISNEILALSKGGYADGAIARWRTLFELGIISCFLKDNDNETSKRYLDHEKVRRSIDATVYETYCDELYREESCQTGLEEEELEQVKIEAQNVLKNYKDGFGEKLWDWIPKTKLKNQKFNQQIFRALIEYTGFDRWMPYYNFASSASHGLSRGFHRLGLPADSQGRPLCGASNRGLADPLQNTALWLNIITMCLLTLEPDFESLVRANIIGSFVSDIGERAVAVQKAIADDEESLKRGNSS